MSKPHYQWIKKNLNHLSYTETKRLRFQIDKRLSIDEIGQIIAQREDAISSCPYCHSTELSRWGSTKQGQQRYRCKHCLKTFSSLTGTVFYRMKKIDKWIEHAKCMWLSHSLRYIANHLNINLKTAFAWRHRFLKNPCDHKPTKLVGIIEADETFIPESFKGSKVMTRVPRQRGGGKIPKVPILIVLDRTGAMSHHVLMRNTKESLGAALKPLLSPDSILCTDGNVSYQTIIKELNINIEHKRLIGLENKRVIDKIYHIQTVNNLMMRWKVWMLRFKGVGTAYLDHYLAWFRFMEQAKVLINNCWIKEGMRYK